MGYVGPAVVRRLRAACPDATLIGYDSGYFAHCLTGAKRLPESYLTLQHFGDLRDFPAELLQGVDAVVNLAAISNDPMGNLYEKVTLEINYHAGMALARKAKSAGVSAFVFASSCSVYGSAEEHARNERSAVDPLTAYAQSKVSSERGLEQLSSPGFKVTSLRFATACGMSDRLRLDLVLNDFVASALVTQRIEILSDGTPWRPLIHVSDMAPPIEWAIRRPVSQGGAFLVVNVGANSWNYQVKALAEAVAQAIPGTKTEVSASAQPDKRSYRVDFSLFESLAPAYQPQMSLADAIRDLQAGLTDMGFEDRDFRQSHLMRLNTISRLRERHLLTEDLRWA